MFRSERRSSCSQRSTRIATCNAQLQFFSQTLLTSPTQMESQEVVQQYGSTWQIIEVQVLQPLTSAAPVTQSVCAQVPALQIRLLQTESTSLTQRLSQPYVQQ